MVHLKTRNVKAKLPHLVLDWFDGFVFAMDTWLPVFLWNPFIQNNAHLPPSMQAGASERQRVVVCTLGAIAAGLVGGANGYMFGDGQLAVNGAMSKNPSRLAHAGDCTTQLCGDYNKPC